MATLRPTRAVASSPAVNFQTQRHENGFASSIFRSTFVQVIRSFDSREGVVIKRIEGLPQLYKNYFNKLKQLGLTSLGH